MTLGRTRLAGVGITLAVILGSASVARAAPVLMISIDGLRPADVLDAKNRNLKLPVLTGLAKHGVYASGVRDALPSVTYPNHTTLVTGRLAGPAWDRQQHRVRSPA